jgi:hypothetical protein
VTAPTRFEDRLLEQLREVVAAQPAPDPAVRRDPPRRRRTAVAGAAAALALTAGVVAVTTGSDATPSAFAVETRADGRVTVEIERLSDADGLERRLRDAGVPAEVEYVEPRPRACGPGAGGGEIAGGSDDGGPRPGPERDQQDVPMPEAAKTPPLSFDGDRIRFTIDPRDIGPGQQAHITIASHGEVTSVGIAIRDDAAPPVPPPTC